MDQWRVLHILRDVQSSCCIAHIHSEFQSYAFRKNISDLEVLFEAKSDLLGFFCFEVLAAEAPPAAFAGQTITYLMITERIEVGSSK
jgi:hypothetical protein